MYYTTRCIWLKPLFTILTAITHFATAKLNLLKFIINEKCG